MTMWTRQPRSAHFVYCPTMVFLPVWPHHANARGNRCQENLNSSPFKNWRRHQDALVPLGWRLSSKTWTPITCLWIKQLAWLKIVHSAEWCRHLALCTPSGACQKWVNILVQWPGCSNLVVRLECGWFISGWEYTDYTASHTVVGPCILLQRSTWCYTYNHRVPEL